jgi:hypothetical protein
MTQPPWHALLAPLPLDAVPRRAPVASAEVLATAAGAAVAGWEQLVLELSAGALGLRVVQVVRDRVGTVVSASDGVLYRSEAAEPRGAVESRSSVELRHESIGGRFEQDGSFHGMKWRTVGIEAAEGRERQLESTASAPTTAEVAALRALVAQLLERQPPQA